MMITILIFILYAGCAQGADSVIPGPNFDDESVGFLRTNNGVSGAIQE